MRAMSLIAGAVGGILFAAGACAQENIELPPGANRELVYGQCRTCHDLQYLKESAGIPRDAWEGILDAMKQYGLHLSPEQRTKILDYLATYLGPNPPPASAAAAAPAPAATQAEANGAAIFRDQCAACHQANGQGVPGQFPPLAGNSDLFLSRQFPIYVVLFGMQGDIKVEGKSFNNTMPPFEIMSDREIAAVIDYVRGAWNNDKLNTKQFRPLKVSDVKAVRGKKLTSAAVHAYRNSLQ